MQKQPANAPLAWVTQVPLFWHGFGKQPFNGVVVVVVVKILLISHKFPENPLKNINKDSSNWIKMLTCWTNATNFSAY